MRRAGVLAAALLLAGCVNGFSSFYTPVPNSAMALPPRSAPQIVRSGGDAVADEERMYRDGFVLIGYSAYNGPAAGDAAILQQAQKVGAEVVIYGAEHTETVQGAMPVTTPTTTTTYNQGSIYGANGSVRYNGTSTTYGSSTSYIPYSVARYDHLAAFYAPMPRARAGLMIREVNAEEARRASTMTAGYIRSVRRGSPAEAAGLVSGDIIVEIDGQPIVEGLPAKLSLGTSPVSVTIVRGNDRLIKTIPQYPTPW